MCRETRCHVCGKTTWTGCGDHVASIRNRIPPSEWCEGSHSWSEMGTPARTGDSPFSRLLAKIFTR